MRIISLVPSQTELLFDLGLEERVVGITKFCVHPGHWRKSKTIIGGTKNIDVRKIKTLNPDLIIGNKEENDWDGIRELQHHFPVWISDVKDRSSALQMIEAIGKITDTELRGKSIIEQITSNFKSIQKVKSLRALYLIWQNPWMAAGNDTFIHSMLFELGLINCVNEPRYPSFDENQLKQLNPEVILLSTEPFPFTEKHKEQLTTIFPSAKVLLVDGEMFSWYGSRMRLAPDYFASLTI